MTDVDALLLLLLLLLGRKPLPFFFAPGFHRRDPVSRKRMDEGTASMGFETEPGSMESLLSSFLAGHLKKLRDHQLGCIGEFGHL